MPRISEVRMKRRGENEEVELRRVAQRRGKGRGEEREGKERERKR